MEKTKENYLELILLLQGTTFINRSILKRAWPIQGCFLWICRPSSFPYTSIRT
jgi:hypothetical protein